MKAVVGLLLVLMGTASCEAPPPPPPSAAALAAGATSSDKAFSVVLPESFELVGPQKDADFDIYEVRKATVAYAKIYVGNFPTFPTEGEVRTSPDKPIAKDSAKITYPSGLVADEYLLPTSFSNWPRAIHVWAQEVPGDQEAANRLAASVTAR